METLATSSTAASHNATDTTQIGNDSGICTVVSSTLQECQVTFILSNPAGEIAALIAERGLLSLLAPVARVTGYDTVIPLPRLEQFYMPSVERIAAATRKTCQFG